MTDGERDTLEFIWNDCRELIAALKVQRWDVCKWCVTVNLTVAAASITLRETHWLFGLMAIGIAASGTVLVHAYNRRITGVRGRLTKVVAYLTENHFDFNKIFGLDIGKPKNADHDSDEIAVFWIMIFVSAVPAIAAWAALA